jgi:magnesium transporter
MENTVLDSILEQVRAALERNDLEAASAVLEGLRPPDQAELFAELADEEQVALLPALDPEDSADILEEMEDEDAAELADQLPAEALIPILDEMEPDEAADLLGDIDPARATAILAGLEDPDEVRPLMVHADDSAGGLMTTEFLALRRRMTAGEAINAIRIWHPEAQVINDFFVVDAHGSLKGVVNLRQLVLASPSRPVQDIMETEVIFVRAGADQEEVARLMARYDLSALPVVNGQERLIGVITIDDVVEVLEDEATEDIQRLGGSLPLERPYLDTGVFTITRKRIGWLLLLFVTESLTGSVLRHFEDEIQAAVALSFFVPLLIGTGGNAGSKTTSTIIRALAVGDLATRDVVRAFWHELRAGLLLGLGMAVIAFGRAILWGTGQPIAWTVSLAILAIVVWANALGALLPLIAHKLKIDPTVVSGPAMSTVVDATGLFIYFTIAAFLLQL